MGQYKYVLLVYYKNYILENGGTEKYIKSQIVNLNAQCIDSVVIFPITKKISAKGFTLLSLDFWGLVYKDKYYGVLSTKDVLMFLEKLYAEGNYNIGTFIHHLIHVNLYELSLIMESSAPNTTIYLHDFYTACIQWNLLKNSDSYCGNALLNKEKCNDCSYFIMSVLRKNEIKKFFESIKGTIRFVAPSQCAASLWTEAYPEYAEKLLIQRHQLLIGTYPENREIVKADTPLKIAFVGAQLKNKGYIEWEAAITKAYEAGCNYEFYHFGNAQDARRYVKVIPVAIQQDGQDAMIKALREHQIHCAVLYSNWPETYSYTYYESFAANGFIITNENSGNIAAETRINGNGIILNKTATSLEQLLLNEERLRQLLNQFRKTGLNGPEKLEDIFVYDVFLNTPIHSERKNVDSTHLRSMPVRKQIASFLYWFRYRIK